MAREPRGGAGQRPRKKERKNISSGVAHVLASFNNTVVTITDALQSCRQMPGQGKTP